MSFYVDVNLDDGVPCARRALQRQGGDAVERRRFTAERNRLKH